MSDDDDCPYVYEIYDQSDALCYRVQSWQRIPMEFFNPFLDLPFDIVLDRIKVIRKTGSDFYYLRLGGLHGGRWAEAPDPGPPRRPLQLIGGIDVA